MSTEGSTYQKAGAKCFVSEARRFTGLLGHEGARSVLKCSRIRSVLLDKPFQGDIDTPEDYEQLLRKEVS
ncbi:hypothetical protein [Parageobacillus genomosp. 1]|uniref:hypothetical protein n=1 Tax=Parageobacillus genomosp. 1 TaxID=1295642 RepID=UPI0021B0CB6D|nr:hypothetical protein [Parageobacillus genomosp. 1]